MASKFMSRDTGKSKSVLSFLKGMLRGLSVMSTYNLKGLLRKGSHEKEANKSMDPYRTAKATDPIKPPNKLGSLKNAS